MDPLQTPNSKPRGALDPFRRAIVRGLGVLLPPLLTVVIILWAWNTVANYLLVPAENAARRILLQQHEENILDADEVPANAIVKGRALIDGRPHRQTADGKFIPAEHYDEAELYAGRGAMPNTAEGVYQLYVERKFLPRYIVVPISGGGGGAVFLDAVRARHQPTTAGAQCVLVREASHRLHVQRAGDPIHPRRRH
jgi:hypothetical protein